VEPGAQRRTRRLAARTIDNDIYDQFQRDGIEPQDETFGIHINYAPVTPQPAKLPNSAPSALKGGSILVS
jgi:hypothetical protein